MSDLLGLRGRIAAAFVAISVLTLVVTALLLLFPLDRKLRQDVLESLGETARTARPTLQALPARALTAGDPRLERAVRELRRRSDANVFVFDASAKRLGTSDPDDRGPFPEVSRALREKRLISVFGRGDGRAQAQVAVPFDVHGHHLVLAMRRSLQDLNGAQKVVERSLIAAVFVALAVALGAGIALATRLVRRLQALRTRALQVAETGPGVPVPPDGSRDEVGDLTRAFATMQQRLEAQEQARRTFVSTASHELRTPLASLRLMLHAAEEDLDGAAPDLPEARDQVTRALRQTVRLGRLADELLNLSRLDAGVELRAEPVELGELTRSVLAEFGSPVDLRSAAPAWATADPGAAARIVRIVIDNAVRHSGPDGQITARVEQGAGGAAAITVTDTGPGVATGDEERIFERFERGPEARDDGGFGLGLAIGRELARQMGGDLRLVPGGPGATFQATFPRDPEAG